MILQSTQQLIDERQKTHGDAHKLTNAAIKAIVVHVPASTLLMAGISWFMILNKLMRLLYNPTNIDTWQDIEGWAVLGRREVHGNVEKVT